MHNGLVQRLQTFIAFVGPGLIEHGQLALAAEQPGGELGQLRARGLQRGLGDCGRPAGDPGPGLLDSLVERELLLGVRDDGSLLEKEVEALAPDLDPARLAHGSPGCGGVHLWRVAARSKRGEVGACAFDRPPHRDDLNAVVLLDVVHVVPRPSH